jgi:hypothetical protein
VPITSENLSPFRVLIKFSADFQAGELIKGIDLLSLSYGTLRER